MTTTYRRPGGLAVLVAAAAIGLAACGGSPSSSQVASLGNSSGSSTSSGNGSGGSAGTGSSTTPKGNPTQLVDEWAACMRKHGDPGQADPTIDASKAIHVTMSPGIPGGVFGYSGHSGSGPGRFCLAYLNAASAALNGGQAPKQPSLATQLKFAECMRANGVPKYPDPSGGAFNLGALDPYSPTFQNANKVCYKKTGVQGLPGSGPPQPGDIDPSYG